MSQEWLSLAIEKYIHEKLYSANEFRDVVEYFKRAKIEPDIEREATLFFQLVHQLYEKSSVILTSNRSPEEWTELVDNQGMMTAILDRLLHRVEVIYMNNESHRMKHQQTIFNE